MKAPVFLMVMASVALGSFLLIYLLKGSLLMALPSAAAVSGLFLLYLHHRRRLRLQKFTEQLPDALTMIARSLRAGHSLTGAMELLGQELSAPAGELFRTVYEQQKLGIRINEALAKLLENMNSLDLRFFVTIVNINSEVGGNLAEILEKLADTIRSRLQIRRQVNVYTAQGRLSGYILAVLPIIAFIGLYFLIPGYLDVFFREPKPQHILAAAVGMEVMGFFFIRKIIDIRI
jgi:tight adherence protein B